jgi:pilus assembly protein Flp/PilA
MGEALISFLADQSGVSAVEYGLIAFGIALALLSVSGLGGRYLKRFLQIVAALRSGGAPPA